MNSKPQTFNIGGRWERCRYLDAQGPGAAYFIDKKWNKFIPVKEDRWFQSLEGLWYPHMRGGATSTPGWEQGSAHMGGFLEMETNGTLSTTVFDSNYVYGTSGDSNARMFFIGQSKTINSIFYYVSAIDGSPGALTIEIRDQNTGSPAGDSNSPGTTVLFTTTDTPSGVGWNEITGLTHVPTVDATQWLVLGDLAGDGTNKYTVGIKLNGASALASFPDSFHRVMTTTNGYTSVSNATFGSPMYVLYFSDGTAYGNAFSAQSAPANTNTQKGLYIDGWSADVKLYAVTFGDGVPTDPVGINIWQGSTGPAGGSPFRASDIAYFENSTNAPRAFGFTQPFPTLAASTPYRIVVDVTGGTSNGVPDRFDIGTVNGGGDARIKKAMSPGQGAWYWTEDISSAWSDTETAIPRMGFFVDDWTPDTSSVSSGVRNFPLISDSRSFPVPPTS